MLRVQLCRTGGRVQLCQAGGEFSCVESSAVSSWRGSSAVLRVQLCQAGVGVPMGAGKMIATGGGGGCISLCIASCRGDVEVTNINKYSYDTITWEDRRSKNFLIFTYICYI